MIFILIKLCWKFERKEEYQEVSGKHNHVAKANYYLFDLNEKKDNPFEIVSSDSQYKVDLAETFKEKITKLRVWAKDFFTKHSCIKFNYFNLAKYYKLAGLEKN